MEVMDDEFLDILNGLYSRFERKNHEYGEAITMDGAYKVLNKKITVLGRYDKSDQSYESLLQDISIIAAMTLASIRKYRAPPRQPVPAAAAPQSHAS